MPLIYSAVARGSVLLSEYSVFAGNFSTVAKTYLAKSTNDVRFAYTVDSHVFSFLAEDGYCKCWGTAGGSFCAGQHHNTARRCCCAVGQLADASLSAAAAGYIVVTDEATGRTIPNAFLHKLKEEFLTKYADKGRTVPELGLSNFG